MFAMSMKGVRMALVAVALGVFGGSALGQDGGPGDPPSPQQVLQQCAETVQTIAGNAETVIGNKTEFALGVIAGLAAEGASDTVIVDAGKKGVRSVSVTAKNARQAIKQVTGNCAQLLQAIGAPAPAFQVLQNIRQSGFEAVGAARAAAVQSIVGAVQDATGGGEGGA